MVHEDQHAELQKHVDAEHFMGMSLAIKREWSVDDVWALPDDPAHKYEVVDGELLVSPSPRLAHQRALLALSRALDVYVRIGDVFEVLFAPFDVVFDSRSMTQPDVMVFRALSEANGEVGAKDRPLPELVIEVLSPSTSMHDRYVKRGRYQRSGVECWIVDIEARMVEVWRPSAMVPEILETLLEWHPSGESSPFRLDLVAFFREVARQR